MRQPSYIIFLFVCYIILIIIHANGHRFSDRVFMQDSHALWKWAQLEVTDKEISYLLDLQILVPWVSHKSVILDGLEYMLARSSRGSYATVLRI